MKNIKESFNQKALSAIWRGEQQLHLAFWFYYVYGQLMLLLFSSLLLAIFTLIGQINIGAFLGLSLLIGWLLWSSVGVWRCAFNTKKRIWGYAARIVIVAHAYGSMAASIDFFQRQHSLIN